MPDTVQQNYNVALLMMPLGPIDRPSLGLSLLAQCLKEAEIFAKVFYPNLDFARRIGKNDYEALALQYSRSLIGDWIFSQVLSPIGSTDEFIQSLSERLSQDALAQLNDMLPKALQAAHALIDDWVEIVCRLKPKVLGLSSCYQQHLASLAIAKRIKQACPDILLVLGGTNCNDVMGAETFRQFPFLDAVVSGPGELVFVDLVRRHLAGENDIALPGIYWRGPAVDLNADSSVRIAPEPNLNGLPMPSFDDFFEAWNDEDGDAYVPIETSRGCWWGQKHHCVFCSENGHSMRYRSKTPERVFGEFVSLLQRYPGRKILATDEILDLKLIDSVMAKLAALPEKKQIFFSIKANIRKDQLAILAKAGVTSLQPGIESLADEILQPMRKGVTSLQCIQLLKWSKELGIDPAWAILYGFPFEKPESYQRMTMLLPWLSHLQPPVGAVMIILQRFSPLYQTPEFFGVRNIRPHQNYRFIYDVDETSLERLAYRFDWDCGRTAPLDDYTLPLRKATEEWKTLAETSAPVLFFHDQNNCLIIGDTRPIAIQRIHRLTGVVRLVYLVCDKIRSAQHIIAALAASGYQVDEHELTDIIENLVSARLMLEDKELYLSLAYRVGRNCLPPMDIMTEVINASCS